MTIDVKRKFNDIITAKQNDTKSRYLDVILVDNGVILDLTGHEVRIYGRKADGKEFYNEGIITDHKKGRCQFELTTQALSVAQDLSVEIVIFKDNTEILSTLPFTIHVVKSLMSDNNVESSNEYGALVVLYQNLYEAYALMTEMVEKIGTPEAKAQELNLNTMFEVWDWLITYMEENSTADVVSTVNGINSKIGTSGDNGTSSIFGKLNNIEKNQIKYVVASDNEKIKLLDNVNLRIDHTLNTETTKGVYIGVTKLPYFTGTLKVKVEYSAKFNVANSNNYWRLIVYDTGFASMLDSAATYNNTSFINKIDNKTKGTIFDKYRDGVNGFGSNQINIIDTNIKNGVIENTVKFVGGYIPELVVGVECPSSRQSGYCIIKNVSICYDEVTA